MVFLFLSEYLMHKKSHSHRKVITSKKAIRSTKASQKPPSDFHYYLIKVAQQNMVYYINYINCYTNKWQCAVSVSSVIFCRWDALGRIYLCPSCVWIYFRIR